MSGRKSRKTVLDIFGRVRHRRCVPSLHRTFLTPNHTSKRNMSMPTVKRLTLRQCSSRVGICVPHLGMNPISPNAMKMFLDDSLISGQATAPAATTLATVKRVRTAITLRSTAAAPQKIHCSRHFSRIYMKGRCHMERESMEHVDILIC